MPDREGSERGLEAGEAMTQALQYDPESDEPLPSAEQMRKNAALIAAARNALPELERCEKP